jgi:5'-3' exonuclease
MKPLDTIMTLSNTNTFIFIDGSYFCFYRYHALINWWRNAYPEELDVLTDPYKNEKFVEKFKKTFVENVQKIPRGLKLDKNIDPIIFVGKDCKRENIWRNELYPKYKANRANGAEDGFMGGPFFKMAYDEELFIEGGARYVFKHPKFEADDCIAIMVKNVLQRFTSSTIYIIASDKDYLQLARDNVHIYTLTYKNVVSSGNHECDLFCKTVMGDKSDNIESVFPKCGPKTALKYYENPALFEAKLNENVEFKNKYELNKKIIDFNNIPEELVNEFTNKLS